MAKSMEFKIDIKLDNADACSSAVKAAIRRGLEACGMRCADIAATPVANGGNCPEDTGNLRDSITSQMESDRTVVIGSNVDYAVVQELGGRGCSAPGGHKFLTKACTEHTAEYKSIIEASLRNA